MIRQKSQENATLVEWIAPRGLLPRRRDARKSLDRQTFVQTVKQPAPAGYISCSSETTGAFRYRSGLIVKILACQRQEAVRPPLQHQEVTRGEIRVGGPGGPPTKGRVDRYGTGVFMSV